MGLTGIRAVGAAAAVILTLPVLAACDSAEPSHEATSSCAGGLSVPTMKIPLNTIHANVWNASGKNGMAATVASRLSWRGVKIIDTGNDPTAEAPPKHAVIRYGPNGKQIALTLAQQIQDAKLEQDDRTNPSVDVVIGMKFALVPVPPPAPSKITINVYNAYVIPGTAGDIAAEMRKRGFHVDKVGNDTSHFYPDHAVVLRYGARGEPAARRVALQFHDVRMVENNRNTKVVDVVIGSKWTDAAVVPAARATPKPTSPAPTPTCLPLAKAAGG